MKRWWESKTIIFNMIVAMLISLEEVFATLKPALGDYWYGILLAVLTMGNVALRFITTQPIGGKKDAGGN